MGNGLAVVLGGAFLLSASADDDCPPDADVSCGVGRGLASGSQAGAGALFLLAGAIGIAANLLIPTKHPAPTPPAPARSAMAGSIWTVEASLAAEPTR